jgi:uncharacterized protein DUF3108
VIAVLLVATLARPATRAEEDLALHYDVYWLAFRILSVDLDSRVEPAGYRTTVSLETAGILATLAPWRSQAEASGAIDGAMLHPLFYRGHSAYRDRRQSVDLEYERGGTVRGDVEGVLMDGDRDAVPDELRRDTVDPLTASTVVARRLVETGTCAGTVPVFDGLRRYDLAYEDLGAVELEPSRRDAYRGPARHCRATVAAIAGFLRTGDRAGERATDVSAWLAPPLPGASPVAVRIEVVGTRGTLRAHLAHAAEPGGS